jgi:hypothetical protein
MSELGELLAGIDKIRLRQSRAIAQAIDRQARLAAENGGSPAADGGYEFAVAVVAAVTGRPAAEIEEMDGSILELGPAVRRIMEMAGFAVGEAGPPERGRPRTASGTSMAPSPPAAATRPQKSAR